MKAKILYCIVSLSIISCTKKTKTLKATEAKTEKHMPQKEINQNLPTIGILIFEGVIINEVVAALDIFSNTTADGKTLFNVITIAKENKTYASAHGLKITPDYIMNSIPDLKVLVVPSSYTPEKQTTDKELVAFIQEQNKSTDYIASHCAGAFLIGEAGIADHKKIVTYVTGGESLKAAYPKLDVVDDSTISVIEDGKFTSSNGSLVSYIASFDLLEKMTSTEHRKYVETAILFDRLKN